MRYRLAVYDQNNTKLYGQRGILTDTPIAQAISIIQTLVFEDKEITLHKFQVVNTGICTFILAYITINHSN